VLDKETSYVDLKLHYLNQSENCSFSGDFLLPMHGVLFSDSIDRVRPESFNSVVELLRDAATLSISENLGGNLIKSMSGTERKRIVDKYGSFVGNIQIKESV
jgi:hypothetical protein